MAENLPHKLSDNAGRLRPSGLPTDSTVSQPKLNKSWLTRLGLRLQMLFREGMDVYDCGSEAPAH